MSSFPSFHRKFTPDHVARPTPRPRDRAFTSIFYVEFVILRHRGHMNMIDSTEGARDPPTAIAEYLRGQATIRLEIKLWEDGGFENNIRRRRQEFELYVSDDGSALQRRRLPQVA